MNRERLRLIILSGISWLLRHPRLTSPEERAVLQAMHSLYAGSSAEDALDRLLALLPGETQSTGEKPP
jgi:hypothetical protein